MTSHDVVIVGGGPAAAVAAIRFARAGASTCIVPGSRITDRIESLAPAAMSALGALGLPTAIAASLAHRCPGIRSSWDTPAETNSDFIASPGEPPSSIDRRVLDRALLDRARDEGVTITHAQRARSWCASRETSVDVELDSDAMSAGHLILATGGSSLRWRRDHRQGADDQLIALVAREGTRDRSSRIDKRLLIEATSDGWWYALAGPGGDVGYALVTDRQTIAAHGLATTWSTGLSQAHRIVEMLDNHGARADPVAIPVQCRLSPMRPHPRVTRIGDALASFDPISGRGLSEAIRNAGETADAICTGQSLDEHERRIGDRYRAYIETRASYYASAWRRFGSAFWRRRAEKQMSMA